ncbi:SDR family oxidoreductase [Polyangium mundeleinium]|uniref:SDR family oxidoreductase n=1 Tax=Polyangium mundeleinium TaxID=2995306 RepID=A0ABT5ERJ1_9BACT|nr:SDR family oxidoreductase [Polyangium mundeleinium]MDC0744433.1 SDR family oxidoreductase [Polyangium mundeleinium]
MASKKTVLVLGATGGIGGEVARALRDRGFAVRALHRDAARVGARDEGLVWMQGDAMRGEDVRRAAEGASILVHAVNPPGYRRWSELVLPMLESSLAAARAVGARLVLPGTIYNYGPNAFPVLHEDSPQDPVTRKGAIRVEMERRLRAAAASGVRTLIVRAGDFFGPRAGNNWFSQGLVQPGKPVRTIQDPGRRGIGHQWSYLPDVAKTMVELIEREEALPAFASYHMAGHWDEDGTRMVDAIRRVVAASTGGAAPKVRAFPWWALGLAAPFVPLFREMKEMRYLWQQPIRMDNRRLLVVLGQEPHTPLDEAVRATLAGLGCS